MLLFPTYIYFQEPRARVIVWLLHLVPLVMLFLTRGLPWPKARDRIALTQLAASGVYLLLFPVLYFWGIYEGFSPILENIIDAYSGMGWANLLPLLFAWAETMVILLVKGHKAGEEVL